MSWKIGKKIKEANPLLGASSKTSSTASPDDISRSTTPTPGNSSGRPPAAQASDKPIVKSGLLKITVNAAKGLSLPAGATLPPSIANALKSSHSHSSSLSGSLTARKTNRDSVQRKQCWWLPYLVLEFDKNEVLIEALGGEWDGPVWRYTATFDVSRASEISISAYLRSAPPSSTEDSGMGGTDVALGMVQFMPELIDERSQGESWHPVVNGTGEMNISVAFMPSQNSFTIDSFELLKVIGKGSFGKVMQVRKRDTGRIYALKTIRKAHIVSRSEVTHTLAERSVLALVNNPFIVPLKFSFQSTEKLYLVLSFVNGGELFHHLQREGKFNEERSRFYAAELLVALEHLHGFNVVYRDLKPENILLDYTGHIALCDFGLCKLNMSEKDTTNTFCGTPEYLAPELLSGHGYTKNVDWWTLGVLLYEMLTGLPPFYDENTNEMYRRILQDPLRFPEEVGAEARSLLVGLLNRDPAHRLGNGGAQDIKNHPFFARHIDWKRLIAKKIPPPFKPAVASAIDTSNFDEEFTSEVPMDSVVDDSHLSSTVQAQFQGFSWSANDGLSSSMA